MLFRSTGVAAATSGAAVAAENETDFEYEEVKGKRSDDCGEREVSGRGRGRTDCDEGGGLETEKSGCTKWLASTVRVD